MSIFSSWEAAPNSGVITYSDTSTYGTIARRPARCPASPRSPGRSRRPAGRDGVGQVLGHLASRRGWRASGRDTGSPSREFIRIRSPSRAPPPRRRVGSTASTAIRSLPSWSSRNRRTSSSVSEDFPEPPVPVMPSTGTGAAAAASRSRPDQRRAGARPPAPVSAGPAPVRSPASTVVERDRGQSGRVDVAVLDHRVDHPGQAEPLAVLRGEDPHPGSASRAISSATMTPPPPPKTLTCPAPSLARALDQVAEVLDVSALVGADGDALRRPPRAPASTTSSTDRLCPRWTTSAPWVCRIRRMMLIDASCPSKRLAAVTKRTGCIGRYRASAEAEAGKVSSREGVNKADKRTRLRPEAATPRPMLQRQSPKVNY